MFAVMAKHLLELGWGCNDVVRTEIQWYYCEADRTVMQYLEQGGDYKRA